MIKTHEILKTYYKVSDFISWKSNNRLDLSPEFQRRAIWKPGAKSYLMDTIYRGLPIPIIFLRDLGTDLNSFEPLREVVDGQQRLRTVISYVAPELLEDYDPKKDNFSIKRIHNTELYNKSFSALDSTAKQRILNYQFSVHELPTTVDDREIIQIFRRMNSTNYTLNKQELRNADYFGEFKTISYQLAAEQLNRWRKWGTFLEDDIARMAEVEFTSECLILISEGKITGKSMSKINDYYQRYDDAFDGKEIVAERFQNVLDFIDSSFGGSKNEFVFYKKTLLYTFFAFVYNLLYGLETGITAKVEKNEVTTIVIGKIKHSNERLKTRSASKDILEATDRRTTNPRERKILYEYLNNNI